MARPAIQRRTVIADLSVALSFYTRLPLRHGKPVDGPDVARASWAAPVVGALVGCCGAIVYWGAHAAGLPVLIDAGLTLAATAVLTGCLHEDGLADTADGFGGGASRECKLEIMRDSRIGTYGVCALVLSLIVRAAALAALAEPMLVAPVLIAAHAAARAALPVFMRAVPTARRDGLAVAAGVPPRTSALVAALVGVVALVLGLGPARGVVALVLACLVTGLMAWQCVRQIGGQTGDVLGAVEQANEIAILVAALVRA
jgi:adenosylcobinamide-GDP ribazoletransferase